MIMTLASIATTKPSPIPPASMTFSAVMWLRVKAVVSSFLSWILMIS